MKYVIFNRLSIKNFLSVGEEVVGITFNKGLNIITGINKFGSFRPWLLCDAFPQLFKTLKITNRQHLKQQSAHNNFQFLSVIFAHFLSKGISMFSID